MSRLAPTTLALCLAVTAQAQMAAPGAMTLRGEVEGIKSGEHLFVELYLDGRFAGKTAVLPDGTFEIRGISQGHYDVRVADSRGEILRRDWTQISSFTGPLTLRLPKRESVRPAGAVSLKHLASPPPKTARKLMVKAQNAVAKGHPDEAISFLRQAIELHPEFVEARNNLGVRLMQRGEYAAALEEFRTAAAIDPAAGPVNANMALSLIHLNRHAEAESPARLAIRAEPDNPSARYALGLALAVDRGPAEEAIGHLKIAAGRFPQANLAMAQVLASKGRTAEASAALRTYLGGSDVPQRTRVESWLANLEKPPIKALR